MLVVDVSASGQFGSGRQSKNELAAELAAVLAFSAIRNNDKVGVLLFTDRIEKYIAPKKGRRHVVRVIREILAYEPDGSGTDLSLALDYLNHVQRRRAVCFLLSDFQAEDFQKELRVAGKRHDVVALSLRDPREEELPAVGLVELRDAETGARALVDTFDSTVREALELMQTGRFRNVPIIDEDGVLVGIVREQDILKYLAETFPEELLNLPPRPHQQMQESEGA